jgi:hypothetical protein
MSKTTHRRLRTRRFPRRFPRRFRRPRHTPFRSIRFPIPNPLPLRRGQTRWSTQFCGFGFRNRRLRTRFCGFNRRFPRRFPRRFRNPRHTPFQSIRFPIPNPLPLRSGQTSWRTRFCGFGFRSRRFPRRFPQRCRCPHPTPFRSIHTLILNALPLQSGQTRWRQFSEQNKRRRAQHIKRNSRVTSKSSLTRALPQVRPGMPSSLPTTATTENGEISAPWSNSRSGWLNLDFDVG